MFANADSLLRGAGPFAVERRVVPGRLLFLLLFACGAAYGAVLGSFGLRWTQVTYSATKLPILLVATTSICLPNFFVMNALLGLRRDFPFAVRGILAASGTLAVALVSLSPVTLLFYLSIETYPAALVLNAALFAIAALCAQRTLLRHYRPLIERDRRHRWALATWFGLYGFVGIKMASILRPFVGDPALPAEFFREGAFDANPYKDLYDSLYWLVLRLLQTLGS